MIISHLIIIIHLILIYSITRLTNNLNYSTLQNLIIYLSQYSAFCALYCDNSRLTSCRSITIMLSQYSARTENDRRSHPP